MILIIPTPCNGSKGNSILPLPPLTKSPPTTRSPTDVPISSSMIEPAKKYQPPSKYFASLIHNPHIALSDPQAEHQPPKNPQPGTSQRVENSHPTNQKTLHHTKKTSFQHSLLNLLDLNKRYPPQRRSKHDFQ